MEHVDQLRIHDSDGGAVLTVKAVPNSSRDRIIGPLGEALKIATAAAPEKGKANAAIARTLAGALGMGKNDVTLVTGQSRPRKEFRLAGLSADEVRRRLAKL
jgi:hypothetical protein